MHKQLNRKPGRPKGTNTEQREQLLDITVEHYARHGIGATSLRAIANAGGVTPAMISYYFGSKDQLLDAVINERLIPAFDGLRQELLSAGDNTRTLVRTFVTAVHAMVRRHPWLPGLWIREVVNEDGALRQFLLSYVVKNLKLPSKLAQAFQNAREQGSVNPHVEPHLLPVSLIGLTMFPLATTSLWQQHFSPETLNISQERLQDHTIALLEHGLFPAADN